MKSLYKKLGLFAVTTTTILSSCMNLDEVWYDQVTPDTFFKSPEDVLAVVNRPFTHAAWYDGEIHAYLDETTADQMVYTQKGPDWYDGGINHRFLHHKWTPDDSWIWDAWRGATMGIALCIDTKSDLEKIDYKSLTLTEKDKEDHINQLNVLSAYFYWKALNYFGPFIIFEDPEKPVEGRRSAKAIYNHIENLLKESMPYLYTKVEGAREDGSLHRAAAAVILARLYFNAKTYIGEDKFAECETICQDIIDGKYGYYDLDENWYGPHSFENDKSKSVIWSHICSSNKYEFRWPYENGYYYNCFEYFDFDNGADNGLGLQPSLYPGGQKSYKNDYKLGCPYEKFNDKDLRKQPYQYLGGTNYKGMFLVGNQKTPDGEQICGTKEYNNEPLIIVDYVARMKTLEPGQDPATLPSNVGEGEENSQIRLVKMPIANKANKNLRWEADHVILRLEEVYYMLAECKMRKGDKAGAAELINKVRCRAFENREDPDPVTAENLDEYRMLDEWGIEFLGEGRRRIDLRRWNKFTTEKWWDHEPSDPSREVFPVPTDAISGNNSLAAEPK